MQGDQSKLNLLSFFKINYKLFFVNYSICTIEYLLLTQLNYV